MAQPDVHRDDRHEERRDDRREERRDDRHVEQRFGDRGHPGERGAGPGHGFYRGGHLPSE